MAARKNIIPLAERFWAKVNKHGPVSAIRPDLGPCWLWTAGKFSNGYGQFKFNGKGTTAHRVAYFLTKGPIPLGFEPDHLCKVRACQNPDHLEAVTQRINTLRNSGPSAQNAKKTHCKFGHLLTDENNTEYGKKHGLRLCHICHKRRSLESWYRLHPGGKHGRII